MTADSAGNPQMWGQPPAPMHTASERTVPLFDLAAVPSSRPCTFRPARADAVKVGRRDERPAFSGVPRPRLDGGEHGGRLKASREPRSAAVLEAPALVAGLDDDAVMREPVQERRRHLGIEEHVRPFAVGATGTAGS